MIMLTCTETTETSLQERGRSGQRVRYKLIMLDCTDIYTHGCVCLCVCGVDVVLCIIMWWHVVVHCVHVYKGLKTVMVLTCVHTCIHSPTKRKEN